MGCRKRRQLTCFVINIAICRLMFYYFMILLLICLTLILCMTCRLHSALYLLVNFSHMSVFHGFLAALKCYIFFFFVFKTVFCDSYVFLLKCEHEKIIHH